MKGGVVDMVTSENDGHLHGIYIDLWSDGLDIWLMGVTLDGEWHDHFLYIVDGEYLVAPNNGHTHTIDQDMLAAKIVEVLTKNKGHSVTLDDKIADFIKRVESEPMSATNKTKPENKDTPEVSEETQKQLDDNKAEIESLKKVAALTSDEKGHYDSLTDEDKSKFLDMDEAARKAAINDAKSDDPVVYKATDGTEYRESDGKAAINLAKKFDEAEKRHADELAKSQTAAQKSAVARFKNLSGTDEVKMAVVKALDTIEDDEQREEAYKMLTTGAVNEAFNSLGSSVDSEASISKASVVSKAEAEQEIDRLVKAKVSEKGIDKYAAAEEVYKENPDLKRKAMGYE